MQAWLKTTRAPAREASFAALRCTDKERCPRIERGESRRHKVCLMRPCAGCRPIAPGYDIIRTYPERMVDVERSMRDAPG
jgi:hypothetical protein